MSPDPKSVKPPSANEGIKAGSNFLRGTVAEDLADESTGAISEPNSQLTKFHGLYLQDDRDRRSALKKAGKGTRLPVAPSHHTADVSISRHSEGQR